jgi:site-specific DNA-adenine methylase
MRSPIKYTQDHAKCLSYLKSIIPKGSIINSFAFFSGELEFNLAEAERFVNTHTNRYVIYEFWTCAMNDCQTLYELINSEQFDKFRNKKAFHILQENWPQYKDPYVRSALFFMLNRYSKTGLISSGEFNEKNFNPVALSYLKSFKPINFHLNYTTNTDLVDSLKKYNEADYLLLPIGSFSYNLFEHGKSMGFEQTRINHRKLHATLKETEQKWIIIYRNHNTLHKLYEAFNITMIDKYGRTTKDKENCEEIVVTNF